MSTKAPKRRVPNSFDNVKSGSEKKRDLSIYFGMFFVREKHCAMKKSESLEEGTSSC